MATYAVGDIQGCFSDLLKLLDKMKFDWDKDKLWVCGDLVNRGPQSLNVVQYLYQYRDRVRIVLGNHDLHLLAVANGIGDMKFKDTFRGLLSPQNQHLIEWLYQQPLAHYSEKWNTLMVHAGVGPDWNLKQTLKYADEISSVLKDPKKRLEYFASMYGNEPDTWSPKLKGVDRWRYITNALTRMRFCYPDGRLDMLNKSAPGKQPSDLVPWFILRLKLEKKVRVVFGHWAALEGKLSNKRFEALDTGKVWGGHLTAMNLKTRERFCV